MKNFSEFDKSFGIEINKTSDWNKCSEPVALEEKRSHKNADYYTLFFRGVESGIVYNQRIKYNDNPNVIFDTEQRLF